MQQQRIRRRCQVIGAAFVLVFLPLQATAGVTWVNTVNVQVGTNSIRKISGCDGCADGGAVSAQEITGDGYAEFVPTPGWRTYAGLGHDRSASTAPGAIDYAFTFWPDNTWDIRELGLFRAAGAFAPGDVFRIAVEDGVARYYQNGVLRYTSSVAPPAVLGFDSTLYKLGSELTRVTVESSVATSTLDEPISDLVVRTEPPLPPLGPAGFTFNDPTFGSRLLRVTDAVTRPGVPNRSYKSPSTSHQNAWNTTSSRFYVVSSNGVYIPYEFDVNTMTARRINRITTGDGGLTLKFVVEPQFSYVDENVIYGAYAGSPRTIAEFNFATNLYTMLLNLETATAAVGTYVGGITSTSGPVEKIAAFYGGTGQDRHFKVVVFERNNPARRRVLDTLASTLDGLPTAIPLNFKLHHSYIDRSGRYVMLSPTVADRNAPRNAPPQVVWDLATDTFTELPSVSGRSNGHDALGYGVWINKDCCTSSSWDAGQWQARSLATPLATRDLISPVLQPKEVYMADHVSWNNADANRLLPILTATYRYGNNTTAWRPWDDEIIAIQTDNIGGGAKVMRYAHHRSDVGSDANPTSPYFWYMPRANISQDGQWAIFTTNWEKTLGIEPSGTEHRQDVFLIALTGIAPPVPNQAPSIRITSPANGAVVTKGSMVSIAAAATDTDGTVAGVTFAVNGATIASVTRAPFSVSWLVPAPGAYTITATALDSAGATTNSAPVSVTAVEPNKPPTVTVTTSASGRVQVGSTVALVANAADSDGVVSRVDFFVNGTPAGTSTTAPFTVPYAVTAPGVFTVTAVAVDNDLAYTRSAAASFEATSEIVIYAVDATRIAGDFQFVADATAAAGQRLWNPNRGVGRPPASATPATFAEFTFFAEAGRPYALWVRGRADSNSWNNDSLYVQFSGTVDTLQRPVARIGTTQALNVVLEQGLNAGLSGWGWADTAYDAAAPPIYFATTGPQTIRFQQREDGISIDQIVISPSTYLVMSPGLPKSDATIVAK